MSENIKLYNGDCIEVMQELIKDNIKVDLILTDPPYGTTACRWDSIIQLDKMWDYIHELSNDNAVCVLFSNQPFTSQLISSNLKEYRYSWVWNKKTGSNFLNCNYMPLKITEDINVFSKSTVGSRSKNPIKYNPQNVKLVNKSKTNNPNSNFRNNMGYGGTNNILNSSKKYNQKYTNYPVNILNFEKDNDGFHPAQKPVGLLEYLIKTYTDVGDLVLDFTMGSGSTGVACRNTNRDFIGIELDDKYYNIANERIKKNNEQLKLV